MIKDSQVLIAIFSPSEIGKLWVTSPGSTGTNPVSYAVGWLTAVVAPVYRETNGSLIPLKKPNLAKLLWR